MAVGVISYQKPQQKQQEESDLDKLGKILGVAATGVGIYDKLKADPVAQAAAAKIEQERQLADPSSPQSLAAGKQYAELGVKIPEGEKLSADQYEQRYGKQSDLYSKNKDRENKKSEASVEGTTGLRKEYEQNPITKATGDVQSSWERIKKSAKNGTPASDISLIYNFMKMNDPGSTVREGEFATAQNAAGVPTQIMNAYNKLLQGTRLAPEQRNDFMNQAQYLYTGQLSAQSKLDDHFRGIAEAGGYNPDLVIRKWDVGSVKGGDKKTEKKAPAIAIPKGASVSDIEKELQRRSIQSGGISAGIKSLGK